MNLNDQGERNQFQVAICALWQTLNTNGKALPVETQRGYLLAMQGLTIEEAKAAIGKAAATCKWFPKPVELLELAKPSAALDAVTAWESVMRHCIGHNVHRYKAIDLSDSVAHAALRAVGGVSYVALQGTTADHERFTRPRFIEAYKSIAACGEGSRGLIQCKGPEEVLVIGAGSPAIESKASPEVSYLVKKLSVEKAQ